MKMQRFFAVAVGSIVLSAGLVLVGPVSAENSDTIDHTTQPHLKSWSNVIPNATKRFVVLADFNNQAVLDRETSLVWEKAPQGTDDWFPARLTCADKTIGGRKGWRLPSLFELSSLVDPANVNPSLPTGHPFGTSAAPFLLNYYWSATRAEGVGGGSGNVGLRTDATLNFWCVRGGMNADVY